jgi:hypothetical protein
MIIIDAIYYFANLRDTVGELFIEYARLLTKAHYNMMLDSAPDFNFLRR